MNHDHDAFSLSLSLPPHTGFSCNLLKSDMDIMILSATSVQSTQLQIEAGLNKIASVLGPPSWDARPSAGASCKGQSLQGSRGRGREVRLLPRRARAREGCRPTRLHGATEWPHATAPARARMPRAALQDVLTRCEPG